VAHLDWRLRIHVISLRELVLLQRSLCSIDDVGAFKARGFPDAWLSTVQPALPLLPAKRKNGGPKPTPLTQNRLRRRGSVFRRTKNGPPSPISRGKWSERTTFTVLNSRPPWRQAMRRREFLLKQRAI
jgi:hypothetical protein